MRTCLPQLLLPLAMLLPAAYAHAAAVDAARAGAHADAPAAEGAGGRWPADAALAAGMQRIAAAAAALEHAEHGHLGSEQVRALAMELRAGVGAIVAACELPPQADAALHPLLAKVLEAAALLDAGHYDAAAHARLDAVLARYPLLFSAPAAATADGAGAGAPTGD